MTLKEFKVQCALGTLSYNTIKTIAANSQTCVEVLHELSSAKNDNIRQAVASNLSTPIQTLINLSKDFYTIRQAVAANPNAPQYALAMLSKSDMMTTRLRVAANPRTPDKVLALLAKDNNTDISQTAWKNLTNIKHFYHEREVQDEKDYTDVYNLTYDNARDG